MKNTTKMRLAVVLTLALLLGLIPTAVKPQSGQIAKAALKTFEVKDPTSAEEYSLVD